MFKQPMYHYPASNGKRFAAFFIDAVIVGSIITLAVYLTTPYGLEYETSGLLFFSYFITLQGILKGTPGKKLLGLRIVTYGTDTRPGVLRLLARETVGKAISIVTLFAGFLFILIDRDHQGLHDKIFGTQVISKTLPRVSFTNFFLQLTVVMTTLVFMSGYILFYTSLPLKQLAEELKNHGVYLTNIRGNLVNGFKVGEFRASNEKADIQIKNAIIKYESLFSIFNEKEINLKRISAAEVNLRLKKEEVVKSVVAKSKRYREVLTKNFAMVLSPLKQFSLTIDRVEIRKLKIDTPNGRTTDIDRIHIAHAFYEDESLEIKKVWIDSSLGRLIVDDLAYYKTRNFLTLAYAEIVVRRAFAPDLISRDIDLSLKAKMNLSSKKIAGTFWAFRSAVRGDIKNDILELKTENLHPYWYFRNLPPIHSFNLRFKGNPSLASLPLKGSYKLSDKHIEVDAIQGVATLFTGVVPASKPLTASLVYNGKTDPHNPVVVNLESKSNLKEEDAISEVLFQLPEKKLSIKQKQILSQNLRYFSFKRTPTKDPLLLIRSALHSGGMDRTPSSVRMPR